MKKIAFTFLLIAVAGFLFAGKGIIVKQKYTSAAYKGAEITITWYIAETQCKMKMDYKDAKINTTTYFIPDIQHSRLITYTVGGNDIAGVQKAYFSIPVQSIKEGNETDVAYVKTQKTGETKSISGMPCEKMVITTNKGVTETWVIKELSLDYYKFAPFFKSSIELMGLSEEKIQGVPLSSVTKDALGNVTASYELISATAAELTDSDFQVPAGYINATEVNKKK